MILIDDLSVTKSADNATTTFTLTTPKIGQFREGGSTRGERLRIRWFKKNSQGTMDSQVKLYGKTTVTMPAEDAAGDWTVEVKLLTREVRNDPDNVLTTTKEFTVQ